MYEIKKVISQYEVNSKRNDRKLGIWLSFCIVLGVLGAIYALGLGMLGS